MTPWVYDGDLTAAHALWVGQLTIKKFKSPPLPHVVPGGGVGVHIDKCINNAHHCFFLRSNNDLHYALEKNIFSLLHRNTSDWHSCAR